MKKQLSIIILSFAILLSALLSACTMEALDPNVPPTTEDPPASSDITDYADAIRRLEDRIVELQQSQYISNAEYQKELSDLMEELSNLKKHHESANEAPPSSDDSDNPNHSDSSDKIPTTEPETSLPLFQYVIKDQKATITGYNGSDAYLVIPSHLDGYEVDTIAENAFISETLRSVVLTNGIRSIEWFAFEKCPNLISVTLPTSVAKIGYSAFCPTSSEFTLYCHGNSYAQIYAQSYGLHYAII